MRTEPKNDAGSDRTDPVHSDERRCQELAIAANRVIIDMSGEINRPGRLLARKAIVGTLRTLAALKGVLPAKMRTRFLHSANKKDSGRFDEQWYSVLAKFDLAHIHAGVSDKRTAEASAPERVLVADHHIPMPDASAGDRGAYGILKDLCALGFKVTFLPHDMYLRQPYSDDLKKLGVEVISADSGYGSFRQYLKEEGGKFGLFYFIRIHVAEDGIPIARSVAPKARVIFHAPDLQFLRETRDAELNRSEAGMAAAEETRRRELAVMRAADHVVLVSAAEIPFLREALPATPISIFPYLYAPVQENPAPFESRRNIFFLGGFIHTPNVDAVEWFVGNVWPLVRKELPGVEFHIVGADAGENIVKLGDVPGVKCIGFVKDLDPLLQAYRLGVAPLRFGAGVKGKIAMTMGAGVPCICTTIAAEGMDIVNEVHTLVADSAEAFAEAVCRSYNDEILWTRFSANGRELVRDLFGNAANRRYLLHTLQQAKALPAVIEAKFRGEIEPL